MNYVTLIPAYGRDYTKQGQVMMHFNNNKDFIITSINDPYNGKPCNKSDLIKYSPYTHVEIRYDKLRKALLLKIVK
jgi:hypothetical protein